MTSDMSMTAVVVSAANSFEVREVKRPAPKPDEVLVRVRHSAICGSDVRLIGGRMEDIAFPLIPGHEWSGEVVEAPRAFGHLVGRPVVSDILQSCGECAHCSCAYRNLCEELVEPGISADGGYAEYIAVKAHHVKPLPAGLPLGRACMVEPLSVVIYALERLQIEPGDRVLVMGGGGIGQLLAQAVRTAGAERVVVADHHRPRLEIARQLGADHVINPRETDLVEFFLDQPSLRPTVAFEASGSARAFRQCLDVIEPAGRVGVIGYAGREAVAVEPSVFMRKLLQVRGVLSPMGSWERAIDMLEREEVRVDPLLTHRLPLSRFAEGLELAASRADGVVRVVIEP